MSRMPSQVMKMICMLAIILLFRKVYCFLFLMGEFAVHYMDNVRNSKVATTFLQPYNIISCNWNILP